MKNDEILHLINFMQISDILNLLKADLRLFYDKKYICKILLRKMGVIFFKTDNIYSIFKIFYKFSKDEIKNINFNYQFNNVKLNYKLNEQRKTKFLLNNTLSDYPDIIEYLIKKRANIHIGNDYILRICALKNDLDTVRYLIKNGANIHADNDYVLRAAVMQAILLAHLFRFVNHLMNINT